MFKLLRAVKSEHRKLWCKRSTFLWIVGLLLLSMMFVFIFNSTATGDMHNHWMVQGNLMEGYDAASGESEESENWRVAAENNQKALLISMHQLETRINAAQGVHKVLLAQEYERMLHEQQTLSYRLEHDIEYKNDQVWMAVRYSLWVMGTIAAVIAVCAASDMFAGEYSRGTIYMNLARPVTRAKQYMAKFITAGIHSALLMVACFLGVLVAGALLGGTGGKYIGYMNGSAYHVSWMQHIFQVLICCYVTIIICIALCAAIGNLTRSRTASCAASIVIAFVSLYFGRQIAPTLGMISGLSLLSCMDLTVPLTGAANYPGLSFNECAVSASIHIIVLYCAGYAFMRKDIK